MESDEKEAVTAVLDAVNWQRLLVIPRPKEKAMKESLVERTS